MKQYLHKNLKYKALQYQRKHEKKIMYQTMTKKINKELISLSVKIMVNFYLRCLWLFNFYNTEKERLS